MARRHAAHFCGRLLHRRSHQRSELQPRIDRRLRSHRLRRPPDAFTAVVKYREIYAAYQDQFWRGTLPKHVLAGKDLNAFPEYDRNPLGTGPYRAKEWKTGEYLLLERHEDYWRGPAAIIHFAPPLAAIEAGGQWNTYEITAFGSHIVVHLNDTLVVDLEDESYSARPIALQNNGGFIRFRNVQVKLL